ncbi:hypothetical protein K2173_025418 [Erythroxylum novogranatense]|uniref:Uncharacterized protein n=1 Tax=Erythroxylum novogranatense TaxID=1862640 RepID=A0AAV8UIZ1_9ROSI|nr:hypothetical protein K2173_025418 [Erythroxylum novogranatense]
MEERVKAMECELDSKVVIELISSADAAIHPLGTLESCLVDRETVYGTLESCLVDRETVYFITLSRKPNTKTLESSSSVRSHRSPPPQLQSSSSYGRYKFSTAVVSFCVYGLLMLNTLCFLHLGASLTFNTS